MRDRFAQSLRPGIESPDDALQLGKFLHQLGGEIGLGQQHRLLKRCMVQRDALGSDRGGHGFCHAQVAFGLAEVAAKILLKGDRLELLKPPDERNLLIEVPEEAGIVEAGAQDSLVAMADDGQAFGIHFSIQHGQEMRRQRGLLVLDREVFLVVAHHGDQNFFRQRQVFGLEVAGAARLATP